MNNDFVIRYAPAAGDRVTLWAPTNGRPVHVTVVKAASGTGKSTLLLELYRAIRDRLSSPLGFDFDPNLTVPEDVAIAFLPQKAPIVRHWRVRDLLPKDSVFVQELLKDDHDSSLLSKRIGQLSGGQCMRVYASSALERLAKVQAHAAFLLLDETLDGVGEEKHVAECVDRITNVWTSQLPLKPLHIMLASHKQLGQGQLAIPNSVSVVMDVVTRKHGELEVRMENH